MSDVYHEPPNVSGGYQDAKSCGATTWEGKPCRKRALVGSPFCDTHQPERVLNRKMRRGIKFGPAQSAQLDHSVRQGG